MKRKIMLTDMSPVYESLANLYTASAEYDGRATCIESNLVQYNTVVKRIWANNVNILIIVILKS